LEWKEAHVTNGVLPVELSTGVALILKDNGESKKARNKQKTISVRQERMSDRKK
jgi:hypothetical protein